MTVRDFAVWVDDVDLRSFDFWPERPANGLQNSRSDSVQTVIGRAGGVLASGVSALTSATVSLNGTLICPTVEQAQSRWRQLKDLFAGTVEFRMEPEPNLVRRVRQQRMGDPQPKMQIGWTVAIDLLAVDPYFYARYTDLYTLPVNVAVPLQPGSAPSDISLIIIGAATNPTVELTGAWGLVQQHMTLTGTLALNETWEVDARNWTITKVTTAGVRTDAASALTDGHFLTLDPLEGTGQGPNPTVKLTGAASAVALVRRAYA